MIGQPPRSTLFPHTPLSRSVRPQAIPAIHGGRLAWSAGNGRAGTSCARAGRAGEGYRTDRKSTRLNSSHQIISYAVFCLKKKKKVHQNKPTFVMCSWSQKES